MMYKFTTKTGKEITIRQPKMSDLKATLKYINKLSKERTFITVQGEQRTLKEEREYIAGFIKNDKKKKGVHLMAFHKKELISLTGIDLHNNVENHIGEYGIAVAKDFRSVGLGKLMTKLILAEAKQEIRGLKIVQLKAFSINKRAINLYKKSGFKEYGRLPKGILYKGKYIDDILMYKNIR